MLAELVANQMSRRQFVMGDIGGQSIFDIKTQFNPEVEEIVLLIGPEGGFSAKEKQLLGQQNVLK